MDQKFFFFLNLKKNFFDVPFLSFLWNDSPSKKDANSIYKIKFFTLTFKQNINLFSELYLFYCNKMSSTIISEEMKVPPVKGQPTWPREATIFFSGPLRIK